MRAYSNPWAIVLAGGEGTRLASLTAALHHAPTPKQFASIVGSASMLQDTLARIEGLAPPERTIVVVCREHLPWVRSQLDARRGPRILVQPASRGTATAILVAARWVELQDRGGEAVILPSDHHVAHCEVFREAIGFARRASVDTQRLTMIGVVPDSADPDYGWLVPGARLTDTLAPAAVLDRFVEKPHAELARHLHVCGALWNTFLMAAPVRVLERLTVRHLPEHAAALAALDLFSFLPGSADLEHAYARMPSADFSADVLQHADNLAVVSMAGAGWSDWGTPERVLATLAGTPRERELRAALAGMTEPR